MPSSRALDRTSRIVRCASSKARGIAGVTWRRSLLSQKSLPPGARYLETMQVTPFAVSQPQISVPSRSIKTFWKPPPGNTITAVPVLRPLAGMIVMVGTAMLRTASDVPPIAPASSYLSTLSGGCCLNVPVGASPGQMRTCSRPGAGRQAPETLTGGLAPDAAGSPAGAVTPEAPDAAL